MTDNTASGKVAQLARQAIEAHHQTKQVGQVRAAVDACVSAGQSVLARSLCELLLADLPEDEQALFTLSTLAEQEGDLQAAIGWSDRLLQTASPSAAAFTHAMYLRRNAGHIDEAMQIIQRGRMIHPQSEDLWVQRLSLLLEKRMLDQALAEAVSALDAGISAPLLGFVVCQVVLQAQAPAAMRERAWAALEAAAGEDPVAVAHWCGRLLSLQGRHEDAIQALRSGLNHDSDHARIIEAILPSVIAARQWGRDADIFVLAARLPSLSAHARQMLQEALAFFQYIGASPEQIAAAPDPHFDQTSAIFERIVRTEPLATPRPNGPVLFVGGNLAGGGAERLLAYSFAHLRGRLKDRQTELLLFDCSGAIGMDFYLPLTGLNRSEVIEQRDVGRIVEPFKWLDQQNTFQWLYDEFRRLKPAVVHATLEYPNLVGGFAAIMAGVPKIIVSTYNMRPPQFIGDAAVCDWMRVGYSHLLTRPEVHFTAISQICLDDYQDWLGMDLTNKATVISSGFDMSAFSSALDPVCRERARRELSIDPDAPVVGVVMRVTAVKCPLLWVEVAAAIAAERPDARFVVFGDGELRAEMEQAVARLGLAAAFRFTGRIPDVYSVLPALDVFLLTSHSEGVPNVLIEAQASGIPVVARPVGAVADALLPGLTGNLVEGDAAALAAEVLAYLGDPVLRRTAGKAAEAFARQRFGMTGMMDTLHALIDG